MSGHSLSGTRSSELVQSLHVPLLTRLSRMVFLGAVLSLLPVGPAMASLGAMDADTGISRPQLLGLQLSGLQLSGLQLSGLQLSGPAVHAVAQARPLQMRPVRVAQAYGQQKNGGILGALFPFLGKPRQAQPQYRQPQYRQPQYQPAQPQFRQPSQYGLPRYGKQSRAFQPTMVPLDSWRRYNALQPRLPESNNGDYQASPGLGRGYRTMCVRLCDGYYWPVNFSSSRSRMGRDRDACESSCGSPAKLFYYSNSGGSIAQMRDLSGMPYSKLKTAFKYRKSFDAACRCKPDPWSKVEVIRHQEYALQARQLEVQKSALLLDGDDYAEKTMPQEDDAVSVLTDDRQPADNETGVADQSVAADAEPDAADGATVLQDAANTDPTHAVTPSFDTGRHRNQSVVFGGPYHAPAGARRFQGLVPQARGQALSSMPGQSVKPVNARPAKAWSAWKNPTEFQR